MNWKNYQVVSRTDRKVGETDRNQGRLLAGMGVVWEQTEGKRTKRKKKKKKDREKGHSQRREHSTIAFCSFFKAGDILFLCVCVCVCVCPCTHMLTLSHSIMSNTVTPWTVAHQAPLSMGFSRQKYCSGLPFPSPEDLPIPGMEPRSPTLQMSSLLSEPPGQTHFVIRCISIHTIRG